MVLAPYVLSGVAAAFFLLIGLEELPIGLNEARVALQVRRRAARRGETGAQTLARMRVATRRSAWVLLGFAVASALVFAGWLAGADWTGSAKALSTFFATLVAGLFFLSFAFHAWAPHLMARVERRLAHEAPTTNPPPRFGGAQP